MKHLDAISDEAIVALNLPTRIPLVYELDTHFSLITPGGAIWIRTQRPNRPRRWRSRDGDAAAVARVVSTAAMAASALAETSTPGPGAGQLTPLVNVTKHTHCATARVTRSPQRQGHDQFAERSAQLPDDMNACHEPNRPDPRDRGDRLADTTQSSEPTRTPVSMALAHNKPICGALWLAAVRFPAS